MDVHARSLRGGAIRAPQNVRSRAVMERIGLVRDPDGDFDHPRVDPIAYPRLVPHVLYRLDRSTWESAQERSSR